MTVSKVEMQLVQADVLGTGVRILRSIGQGGLAVGLAMAAYLGLPVVPLTERGMIQTAR